jgi:hypothetical protein
VTYGARFARMVLVPPQVESLSNCASEHVWLIYSDASHTLPCSSATAAP